MTRIQKSLLLMFVLACVSGGSEVFAAPPRQPLPQEEIDKRTDLIVTAKMLRKKTETSAEKNRKTYTFILHILHVHAKKPVLAGALKAGLKMQFLLTCRTREQHEEGDPPQCGHTGGTLPAVFQKSKGATFKLPLRVLRSAGRILFSTVPTHAPPRGILKGTILLDTP